MPADPCPTCAGAGRVLGDPPASPADVGTSGLVLTDTFGKAEREAAAWLIVRLLQVRNQGWDASFVMRDFAWLLDTDAPTRRRCSNPFFRPDFRWLVDHWFVQQTNPDTVQEPCFVTELFVELMRPRIDCPTCCWRLVDGVPYHIPCRALVLLHPHAVVTWGAPSGYAVTGPDGPTHTRSSIAPANLPSVLAAHGCRMPSDAALAWVRGLPPGVSDAG